MKVLVRVVSSMFLSCNFSTDTGMGWRAFQRGRSLSLNLSVDISPCQFPRANCYIFRIFVSQLLDTVTIKLKLHKVRTEYILSKTKVTNPQDPHALIILLCSVLVWFRPPVAPGRKCYVAVCHCGVLSAFSDVVWLAGNRPSWTCINRH